MRRANRPKWHKTAWLVAGVVLLLIVIGIYVRSTSPLRTVRAEAIKIAENKASVTSVSQFYWDRQRTSYLTVAGTTKDKQKVYVLIHQQTGKITLLKQNSGLTANEAEAQAISRFSPQKIISIGLSKKKNNVVWDVGYRTKSGKLGYVTYDFQTGDQLASIRNL